MNTHKPLFLYSFFVALSLYGAQTPAPKNTSLAIPQGQLPSGAVFNFNVSVHNSQDAKSNNSTAVSTAQTVKPPETPPPSTPIFKKFSDLSPDLQETIKKYMPQPRDFFNEYRWYILGAAVIGSYAWLCSIIMRGNAYLGHADLWSSWRQELPLDKLLAIPQEQFAQELVREIQRRYSDPASILDLVKPLTEFANAIASEEENIKSYQYSYSWISYLKLNKIVPFSKQRFVQIPERLQRIAYFKNVFQTWASQYQLEHATRYLLQSMNYQPKDVDQTAHIAKIIDTQRMLNYLSEQL